MSNSEYDDSSSQFNHSLNQLKLSEEQYGERVQKAQAEADKKLQNARAKAVELVEESRKHALVERDEVLSEARGKAAVESASILKHADEESLKISSMQLPDSKASALLKLFVGLLG